VSASLTPLHTLNTHTTLLLHSFSITHSFSLPPTPFSPSPHYLSLSPFSSPLRPLPNPHTHRYIVLLDTLVCFAGNRQKGKQECERRRFDQYSAIRESVAAACAISMCKGTFDRTFEFLFLLEHLTYFDFSSSFFTLLHLTRPYLSTTSSHLFSPLPTCSHPILLFFTTPHIFSPNPLSTYLPLPHLTFLHPLLTPPHLTLRHPPFYCTLPPPKRPGPRNVPFKPSPPLRRGKRKRKRREKQEERRVSATVRPPFFFFFFQQ
jgi:hypothetical protein